MLAVEFFIWWYTRGWSQTFLDLRRRLTNTLHLFSVSILLRTLFAPWRRIVTYPANGLAERFKAMGDNLVSRSVGFVVRVLTLLLAGFMLLVVAVVNVAIAILWPLLPLGAIAALLKALLG